LVKDFNSARRVKADLISIVDRQSLSPRNRNWSNNHIIPSLIDWPAMVAAAIATMINQAPEIIGFESAAHKAERIQRRQPVSLHLKGNDDRQRSRVLA
jgi:hypothetical protein